MPRALNLAISAALIMGCEATFVHRPLAFDPPAAPRWQQVEWLFPSCEEGWLDGELICSYAPRCLVRRWRNFVAAAAAQTTRIFVKVMPRMCEWADAEPHARAAIRALIGYQHPTEEVEMEASANTLFGHSVSTRVACIATPTDIIWITLNVPGGPTPQDIADFQAVVASVRLVRRHAEAERRGRWLFQHRGWLQSEEDIPICGAEPATRMARAREELLRATRETPERWQPWAVLGQLEETAAGGPEPFLLALVADARAWAPRVPQGGAWIGVPAQRPTTGESLPRTLRRAAHAYTEAARRGPPLLAAQGKRWSHAGNPIDQPTILAGAARAHAQLGEDELAEALYRSVLASSSPSQARVEAGIWLGERAIERLDRREALRLYEMANRAWWSHYESPRFLPGLGPLYRAKIALRLSELQRHAPR